MPKTRASRRFQPRPLWAAAAILLFLVFAVSCGPGPDPKAKSFANDIKSQIKSLSPLFAGPMASGNLKAVKSKLSNIFLKQAQKGCPMRMGIGLLDRRGVYVAGRYPEKGVPEGVADDSPPQNYANFKLVKQALDQGRVAQGELHSSEGTVYAIIAPLHQNHRVVAALGLMVDPRDIDGPDGIGKEAFFNLDLN